MPVIDGPWSRGNTAAKVQQRDNQRVLDELVDKVHTDPDVVGFIVLVERASAPDGALDMHRLGSFADSDAQATHALLKTLNSLI